MNQSKKWKYCVVGNIVKEHIDENGVLRHGTTAFSGGTKVYLSGKLWDRSNDTIEVLGLCRGKRYYISRVHVSLIENVRCQKAYKPKVLEFMGHWEVNDCWWGNSKEDGLDVAEFVKQWKEKL